MGLLDAFTAVQNQMTTTMGALVPPETVPQFLVGADHLQDEGAPPRIVWVPTVESIRGPHAQGGDGIRNPRPLRTRHATVQAHIWGADIPKTEVLANHVVAALNDVAHGAYDVVRGDWSIGQAAANRLGFVYVLEWEVQIPFPRELDTFHAVTAMPITPVVLPPA
jgi:hypothetical protein